METAVIRPPLPGAAEIRPLEFHAQRLVSAIDHIPDAVFLTDAAFRVNLVNSAFHRLSGYALEEVLGRSTAVFRARSDQPKVEEYQHELAEGRDWIGELTNRRRDGSEYPVETTLSPMYGKDGEFVGCVAFERDVTAKRQLQAQMFQTQKMETIGALAAGVAHDFNNLLMAIRGNVTLLLMEAPLGPDVRQRIERIDQAAEQAANITRQLLTFSRASDEQITTLDLNQVILEAGELARRILRKQVALRLETAPVPVKVRLDATRAQQLLLNLCVNAQDAMPQGGQVMIVNAAVQVSPAQATSRRLTAGARFVRCSVSDTGTGIPPAVLSRIFEPFFTTKDQGKGTGLGLAIVQNIVRQAGGFLEVDTQVGRGTTFHLHFPEATGDVSAPVASVAPAIPRGTGRILVVDDQDLVRDFAQKFLRAIGYEVLTADSAESALKVLEREAPEVDLLLTDYSMPGMNGRELIAEAATRWPGMRFILASGYLESEERDQITAAHGTRILHKPFDLAQAADLIAKMLQRR